MQSVGVPCTANCLGPRRSKRSGWFRVRACPWPLCSRSGATTQTVPSWPRISSRTLSPSAPKPSSLVIRIGPALIEPPSGPAIMQCPVTDGRGLVGATGFEPATPCTPSRCATRLRYAPRPEPDRRQRSTNRRFLVASREDFRQGLSCLLGRSSGGLDFFSLPARIGEESGVDSVAGVNGLTPAATVPHNIDKGHWNHILGRDQQAADFAKGQRLRTRVPAIVVVLSLTLVSLLP